MMEEVSVTEQVFKNFCLSYGHKQRLGVCFILADK